MIRAQNYIHALSQIEYHRESGKDLSVWSKLDKTEQEHVAVLEGLALLLIFRPQGDIAAMTIWRSTNECKLLWAKNQPVDDPKELHYIDNLLQNAKVGWTANEMLQPVIDICRDKILRRIQKLAKAFSVNKNNQRENESNLWGFNKAEESDQQLEALLKKMGFLPNISTQKFLDNFTRAIGRASKTSEKILFGKILWTAWAASSIPNLNLSKDQVRYLNKLSDYARIVRRMPALLQKLDNVKITVEQVRPPEARTVEILSGSLANLNSRCNLIHPGEDVRIQSWDDVKKEYPHATPGEPINGYKKINVSQHCELTLALDILSRSTNPALIGSRIEIGVSKACCVWCCEYLHLLSSRYKKHALLLRATHGKQPDGWMMPPNGPKRVTGLMEDTIEKQMDDVIGKVLRRRRSDSNELPVLEGVEVDVEVDSNELLSFVGSGF